MRFTEFFLPLIEQLNIQTFPDQQAKIFLKIISFSGGTQQLQCGKTLCWLWLTLRGVGLKNIQPTVQQFPILPTGFGCWPNVPIINDDGGGDCIALYSIQIHYSTLSSMYLLLTILRSLLFKMPQKVSQLKGTVSHEFCFNRDWGGLDQVQLICWNHF